MALGTFDRDDNIARLTEGTYDVLVIGGGGTRARIAPHPPPPAPRNAPHLVTVLPFLIPVFEGGGGIIPRRLARALGSAMWMYDLTGGLRIGKRHRRLGRDAALAHMPTLDDRLAWAYLYYDAQADDARLTLTVARTAALDHGATVVNHAAVTGLLKEGGRVTGAQV